MTNMRALEIVPNAPALPVSDADLVIPLHNLRVSRVLTTFEFRTCEEYVHRVEILAENKGERDSWIIPSIFYEKAVLVAYSARDSRGGNAILAPSDRNDEILCKLLFYHCWEKIPHQQRKLLYRAFVKSDYDLPESESVKEILDRKFEGQLNLKLRDSMWSGTASIAELLRTPLIDWIPESTRKDFIHEKDLTPENLCRDLEYIEFFEKLHKKFFQLIWLNKPIRPKEYCSITVEDLRILSKSKGTRGQIQRRRWGLTGSLCTIPIEVEASTPLHSDASIHIRVLPPEGVRLDLKPAVYRRRLRCPRLVYANEQTVVDREKIDFYHFLEPDTWKRCDNLSTSLGLESFGSKLVRLSNDDSGLLVRRQAPDMRTRFEDNVVMMYFRRRSSKDKLCCLAFDHFLRFNIDLKRGFARLAHMFIAILLGLTILTTLLLLPQKYLVVISASSPTEPPTYTIKPPWLALVDQYFWPIITLMIAQSAATLLDYSRRPESQQHFLENTTLLIVSLALLEFALLLIDPLILWWVFTFT